MMFAKCPMLVGLRLTICSCLYLLAGVAGTVHVRFGLDNTKSGIFPSDAFTIADDTQKTGLRVNLPLPDCGVHVSDCNDLALINVLGWL